MHFCIKLKKRFEQEAILRNLSTRTKQSYWWHIEDYYKFHKKNPEQTGVHELNPLCISNKKVMCGLLFKADSQTILELTKDTKHLGADIGLITILHTWGQNLMEHPHLHCIMPAGGLSFDKQHWIHPNKSNDFFIHYKVLSQKFSGKYLDLLKQAFNTNLLVLKGNNTALSRKLTDKI